jgi:hypothetical protein
MIIAGVPQHIAKIFVSGRLHFSVGAVIMCAMLSFLIPNELAGYNTDPASMTMIMLPSVIVFFLLIVFLILMRLRSLFSNKKWTTTWHAERHPLVYLAWGDKKSSANLLSIFCMVFCSLQLVALTIPLVPEHKLVGISGDHQKSVQMLSTILAGTLLQSDSMSLGSRFQLAVLAVISWMVLFSAQGVLLIMSALESAYTVEVDDAGDPMIKEVGIPNSNARFSVLSSFPWQLIQVILDKIGFIFIVTNLMNFVHCEYDNTDPTLMCFPESKF